MKKIFKSQFLSTFSGYGNEMVVINNEFVEPVGQSRNIDTGVLGGDEIYPSIDSRDGRKEVKNEGIFSLLNLESCN